MSGWCAAGKLAEGASGHAPLLSRSKWPVVSQLLELRGACGVRRGTAPHGIVEAAFAAAARGSTGRQAEAGIEASLGSIGDNVLAETIDGLHRAEAIHRRTPGEIIDAAAFATLERLDCFKHRRLPEPIGNIPANDRSHAAGEQPALAR